MAIVKAQSVQFDDGFAGGTTRATTYTSALTPGSKLICVAGIGANTTVTFSDSVGLSWTTVTSRFWANVGSVVAIGYADNPASSASSVVVTATYGTSGVFRSGHIGEWTGLATGAPDTFTAGNNQTANTVASDVAMTTTVAGDLILTTAASDGATLTAGTGFTLIGFNASSSTGAEYQIQGSAGSITPTINQSSSVQCIVISAAFKAAAGGGAAYPFELLTQTPRAY